MPPSSGKAQLFAERDYGGAVTTLEEGIHRLGTGTGAGGNQTVSSVKVARGYALTVYSGGNCTGASAIFTADTPDVADEFSGVVRSVEVSAVQTSSAPGWFDEGAPPDWFDEG